MSRRGNGEGSITRRSTEKRREALLQQRQTVGVIWGHHAVRLLRLVDGHHNGE
jgi:hypothetical protein